jgi:hypothetical protein
MPVLDGSIQWKSQTNLKIGGGDIWYESPPRMQFPTHNALVPLGFLGAVQVLAFVSPFAVVATGFRRAAARYAERDHLATKIVDLVLELELIIRNSGNFRIRSVEGTDSYGNQTMVTAPPSVFPNGIQQLPTIHHYQAIEIDLHGHAARLDNGYNIKLADILDKPEEIASCLTSMFNELRSFTHIG